MLKIFITVILLIIGDLFFYRIYSTIAKKQYEKRKLNSSADNIKTASSKKICIKIKGYLFGLYYLNIFLIGLIPSFRIRKFIYKNVFLMKIGKNSKIREFCEFVHPWNIEIGDNCIIGKNCILDGRHTIKIGNNVNISDGVAIYTEQHDINDINFASQSDLIGVSIQDRVWLCFRSVILPNTTIKEGAVVATGAVVSKDCDEFGLYAGVPAKIIKERNRNLLYELDTEWAHIY